MSTKVIVLKPCPFCSGDGGVSVLPSEQVVFGTCWSCGAGSQPIRYHGRPTEQDITQAKEAWNRRAENDCARTEDMVVGYVSGSDREQYDAWESFNEFLELPEDKRLELLLRCKLHWYQRLHIRFINKWWSIWRSANPTLLAHDLWESIYKRRF